MGTLDNFKKEAKQWLKALRDGDAGARARLTRVWPEAPATPVLRDVQHALAREHGFDNWLAVKERYASGRTAAREQTPRERVETFFEFACWDHHTHGKADHRMHDRAAQRILAQHPAIAHESLYAAVVTGDVDEVRRRITERPEAAREPGGPRGWTPILYLAYTRFTHAQTIANAVEIARLLFDHGVNPNDFYKAGDADYTVLVGIAGEGEQDAPRQPYAEELYRLALDRGAGPYDIQVLYNTHFSCDMVWWLELTYQRSLALGRERDWDDADWHILDMGGYGPGAYFVLHAAVARDRLDVAAWALAHGANPNLPIGYSHPKFRPRWSLYDEAVMRGSPEMASLLQRHGAVSANTTLTPQEAFIAAGLRLDREAALAALAKDPSLLHSHAAMFLAATVDRPDVIAFLLDLGTPLEVADQTNARALHHAAANNALKAARFLIDRGAEIDPRETAWGATPIGWAAHGDRQEMLRLLARYSRNVWTLAFRGFADRLREVLREQPDLAKQVSPGGITPLWWLPEDEGTAMTIVELLLAAGADPSLESRDGHTAADWAWKRGMTAIAERLAVGDRQPSWEKRPPPAAPDFAKFDGLARDLLFAFQNGNTESLGRLMDHFHAELTWPQLRTLIRGQMTQIGRAKEGEYFSLDDAQHLIAVHAGFESWEALQQSFRAG